MPCAGTLALFIEEDIIPAITGKSKVCCVSLSAEIF
jgi:hypothetical protein